MKKELNMWTHFNDMHSGGGRKLDYEHIFIEAEEEKAAELFERIFRRDPYNVTCYCCGPDYSINEVEEIQDFYEDSIKITATEIPKWLNK
jgi:hypothetical protein